MGLTKKTNWTTSKFLLFIFILFFVFLLGWKCNAGIHMYGLYSDVDGQLAAWYSKALFEWSTLFGMSTLNPFQGMVSLFIPNSTWWNPAALALSLPFNTFKNYIISYAIYWFEVYFSLYFFARSVGLNKVESACVPQVFVLFLFPIFSGLFWAINFLSLAPSYAHLFAISNLIVVFYIKLGNEKTIYNISIIFILMLFMFIVIMSAPVVILTYVPVYGLICLVFTFYRQTKISFLWKVIFGILCSCILLILKAPEYYKNTSHYLASNLYAVNKFSLSFPMIWKKYNVCQNIKMNLLCSEGRIYIFHIPAFLGGLTCLFWKKGRYRWLAICFCFIAVSPEILVYLFINGVIQGPITQINPMYYLWSAYPLYSIFFVLFCFFVANKIIKIKNYLYAKFPENLILNEINKLSINQQCLFLTNIKIPYILIPVLAFCVWLIILARYHEPLYEVEKTPIVEYLEKKIALKPNGVFRGSTVTYIASKNSSLRNILNMNSMNNYTPDHYIQGREYLKKNYGNRHMFSDLWNYNIPTLEEYGQYVSIPMYIFFKNLLAEPGDIPYRSFLNVYKLDLKILKGLGVRFIISDKILKDPNLLFIMEQKKLQAAPLYLYELINPNVASFSPVKVVKLDSAEEIFSEIKKPNFSFKNTIILQEFLSNTLVPTRKSKIIFERNAIRVIAESKGWSILLLPVQYSHCFTLASASEEFKNKHNIRLIRANLIQSALLFNQKVDHRIYFNFGIGNNVECRRSDIIDINSLIE